MNEQKCQECYIDDHMHCSDPRCECDCRDEEAEQQALKLEYMKVKGVLQ